MNRKRRLNRRNITLIEVKDTPFVEIFRLHKKKHTGAYIARKLKIDIFTVNSIIHGEITIPKSKIKDIESLGFKMCYKCKKRIIPIEPVGYVILTRLCKICYRRGSEVKYSIPSSIKY